MNWNDKTAANVKAIKPSGIRKFFDIAAQVKGVLSLSIGEPDFAAPDKVLAAMKASLDAKETSYTGNSGMMELREAISHHFEQRYGVHYDPKDEILVTVGVSEGLAMALLAITEPGDEVIIPDPAYVAYPASVELAGGTPVFVPTYPEHDFKLTVEALEKVITPKTKAIVIGSLVTVLIFVLGTFSLGFIIPAKDINLTQSLLIGFDNYFHYLRISWASPIIAVALMFGVLAGVLTWVSGPSKGIFAVGRAGYLPPFFQKSNKNGVQRNILLIQGGVVTLLALLFVVMPSVQSFYQILSQLTVLLYLIMYMLMFSAAIVLRYKMKGTARPFRLGKKGNGLMWTIGTVGFCGALLAFILSFVPPSQISVGSNTVWFSVLIIGCVVVVGAPFVIYAMRKPSWKDPQAAAEFAPFHWEVKAAPETQNIPQNNPQNTGNTAPENKQ